jgi:hypothetical protein
MRQLANAMYRLRAAAGVASRLRAFALATDSELRRAVNCQLAPLAEGYFEEVFGCPPIAFLQRRKSCR